MAENKKSFTAYCDWNNTFNSLPDDKAGQLVKHLFAYVNDENPETDDLLINAVFANIKATLKRDLVKWKEKSEKNKQIALDRWNKKTSESININTNVCERIESDANYTDSVSDSVSDSDININKPLPFSFYNSLISLGAKKELVSDWIKVRKNKKLTNTQTAFNKFVSQYNKSGYTINEVLEKCVEKSWGGFDADWFSKVKKQNTHIPLKF
jgi:hypothetical protein